MYNRLTTFFLIFMSLVSISHAQITVACVGNSITEGWGGNPSFVPTLQNLLGSDYTVRNFGKSGATVLKKGDLPYWSQSAFSQAKDSDADIITIMLGTNDTKPQNWNSYGSEFKSDYISLIDALQSANTTSKIFPVLPVPVCRDNYGIRNSILQQQIPIIREIADEKGLTLIDANTPLLPFCSYFADGVHPKQPGADTIATVISRSIQEKRPSLVLSIGSNRIDMSASTTITATLNNYEYAPEVQWSVTGGRIAPSTGTSVTFAPGEAGTFTITATADTLEATIVITAFDPDRIHLMINCGGGDVDSWMGGGSYAGGGESYDFGSVPSTAGLDNPAPAEVYQTVYHSANGSHEYDFGDIPDGDYTLRLHFYDMHDGRTMAFFVEGEQIIEGYDPPNSPEVKEFEVTVEDGNGLQIRGESAGGSDVFLSGIEIVANTATSYVGRHRTNRLTHAPLSVTQTGGTYTLDVSSTGTYQLDIVTMNGATVKRFRGDGKSKFAWKPAAATGVYLIYLVSENRTTGTQTIVFR